jgi:hypothetical protein
MDKKRMTIYLNLKWHGRVKQLADSMGISVTGVIGFLVRVGWREVNRAGLQYSLDLDDKQGEY